MPSTDTMVSKPRTARLDRIRSTMLGSSSTTRAQVLRTSSVIAVIPWFPVILRIVGAAWMVWSARSGRLDSIEDLSLDRQVHAEAGALGQRGQLEPAAVGLHDPLRDGQAQPGSGVLGAAGPSVSALVARPLAGPVAGDAAGPVARGVDGRLRGRSGARGRGRTTGWLE